MGWLLNSQGMKYCKSTEWFFLTILTIYTNDWSPVFYMFTAIMFIFSSAKFPGMCKPRTGWPTLIDILWSRLACLPSWLIHMVNTGWLGSIRSEVFLQMKFIIFKAVLSNRLTFYLGSLLHVISSLFGHFWMFRNAILRKMLKCGF